MKTIKKYAALCLVLACIGCGSMLLAVDYETLKSAWFGLSCAVVFFIAGVCLGWLFDGKELLPK